MNKMYFYYFFTFLLINHINYILMCILFIYLPFSAIFSVYFFVILLSSPIQGLEPGATPAVVGGVLLAILTDRSSLKQKYFRL